MQQADELRAGQNQLQAIGLRTIAELRRLRVLRLPGNGFTEFPGTLLTMQALRVLDLAANGIAALPADVWRLERFAYSGIFMLRTLLCVIFVHRLSSTRIYRNFHALNLLKCVRF